MEVFRDDDLIGYYAMDIYNGIYFQEYEIYLN